MSDELISRSALKKDLEVTPYNDIDDLVRTERLIDNASAVDAYPFEQVQELVKLNQQFAQEIENLNSTLIQNEDNLSKTYGDGYQTGHKEGYDKGYDDAISIKRPKGKKIVNTDANFDDSVAPFFCSKCLRGVHFNYNFCWFCGADLRGDEE